MRSPDASAATGGSRIDLDLRGHTDFERDVWQKALEIPRGEVRPYGWIAAEIGRPKAVRAVGTALGHNPGAAHRPLPPRRPDRRVDRPVLARRPGQQADDPGRRGPRPRGHGVGGPVGHALPGLGHDPHRVPADLPPREADHAPRTGCRSARSGPPPAPATGRAARAGRRPARSPPDRRSSRLDAACARRVHSDLGPPVYANRRRPPSPRGGRRSGSACWSCTSSGGRPTSASPSPSTRSRRSSWRRRGS